MWVYNDTISVGISLKSGFNFISETNSWINDFCTKIIKAFSRNIHMTTDHFQGVNCFLGLKIIIHTSSEKTNIFISDQLKISSTTWWLIHWTRWMLFSWRWECAFFGIQTTVLSVYVKEGYFPMHFRYICSIVIRGFYLQIRERDFF